MLDYLRAQPDKIDVDEAVSATTPLYNQYVEKLLDDLTLSINLLPYPPLSLPPPLPSPTLHPPPPPSLLSLRILQLYAEENALDDTIYHLGEALRKGVIELEVFLKVRKNLTTTIGFS